MSYSMFANFPVKDYAVQSPEMLLTPALLIYPEFVDANITHTLSLLGNDVNRWRPHVKTAKLAFTMRRMVQRGVKNFKCATTSELLTACEIGSTDVLVAYPAQGANAERIKQIARRFPSVRISVLIESRAGLEQWRRSNVGVFIDLNSGMDRTGMDATEAATVAELARATGGVGLEFRGLHYYDGHLGGLTLQAREHKAHAGYDRLLDIVSALERIGIPVEEVVTSGTPAFPCAISYSGFRNGRFLHRVSPGTIVYSDLIALKELLPEAGYRPAALVLSRVVSNPCAQRITCDAGHKALAIDCGVPNCAVLGREALLPRSPSEEHLPIDVSSGAPEPQIGEFLYLVPCHVCPTVNNFDHATIIESGRIMGTEAVTARGHESALISVVGH